MRIAKKWIFVALALLPLFTFALILCNSLFVGAGYVPIYSLGFVAIDHGDYVDVASLNLSTDTSIEGLAKTMEGLILAPFVASGLNDTGDGQLHIKMTGLFADTMRMLMTLNETIGLPLNATTFGSFLLLYYYAFLGLAEMLVDLITFVPRKVSEIFK